MYKDSIAINDTLCYQTPKGKNVYGGGGINYTDPVRVVALAHLVVAGRRLHSHVPDLDVQALPDHLTETQHRVISMRHGVDIAYAQLTAPLPPCDAVSGGVEGGTGGARCCGRGS
jgi:hypothetical protein